MSKPIVMIGDARLLNSRKVAFLSSRRVHPSAVMKSYDWATKVRDSGVCVIGGFQSALEKDVLKFLLDGGTQPVIMVLARRMWDVVPEEFREFVASGRMLVVSPVSQSISRVSRQSAMVRNSYILENCDEAVFASIDPNGSLSRLVEGVPKLKYDILSTEVTTCH